MARNKRRKKQGPTRHRLLVYYNLGRRYRPTGMLLLFLGVILFLPSFIDDLENDLVEPGALAATGGALMLVGLAFLLFARTAMRGAYVQCTPSVLLIRTPFQRFLISYRRIGHVKQVQVSALFPRSELKGLSEALIRPLLGSVAIEVAVKSWPKPKHRLQRRLSKFMFSPREEAWVFIMPDYSRFMNQLDAAIQNRLTETSGRSTSYEDPFERLKYYNN